MKALGGRGTYSPVPVAPLRLREETTGVNSRGGGEGEGNGEGEDDGAGEQLGEGVKISHPSAEGRR
jgi:hypothetical protein